MFTHYDNNGIESSYTMRPQFDLFSNLGFLPDQDVKGIFLNNIQVKYKFIGMYDGIMRADFLIGDFDDQNAPFCDSVALLKDFLTNEQLSERLPATADSGEEW